MRLTLNPLAAMRAVAGFKNAQDVGARLGCTRQHILSVERGRVGASDALIGKMAALYGIPEPDIREAIRTAQLRLSQRRVEALRTQPHVNP
jgi:transcriptional regulator with XRE-family HTH domain